MPLAPGRLSANVCWLQASLSFCASRRAVTSDAPPGGSGSRNGMVHLVGQPADYEGWRAPGNEGWGWKDVQPWFRKIGLPLSDPPQRHALADAFVDAAVEAGHPRNADFNGPSQEGAGYYKLNTRKGRRASTAIVYLRPARKAGNLAGATDALATRILVESAQAVGVEYRRGGEP